MHLSVTVSGYIKAMFLLWKIKFENTMTGRNKHSY